MKRQINTTNKITGDNKLPVLIIMIFLLPFYLYSQGVAVNTTGNAAHQSAMLDVSSNIHGFLLPRMTESQKNAIVSPATGLMIYQTDNATGFWYYDGAIWVQAIGPTGATGATGPLISGTNGQTLRHDGNNWVANSVLYNNGTNIGIGTTNPTSKLTLSGSGSSNGIIFGSDQAVPVNLYHASGGNVKTDNSLYAGASIIADQSISAGNQLFVTSSNANQFMVRYDASNKLNVTAGAGGVITFDAAGTSPKFSFSDNVGVLTTNPGAELDVKGTIRLSGATSGYVGLTGQGNAGSQTYVLPNADGSSGQALTTDGNGNLSWATSSGGSFDYQYPEGLNNITPIILNGLHTYTYTVPPGATFYITGYFCNTSNVELRIDNKIVYKSYCNLTNSNWSNQAPDNPWIAASGSNINVTNGGTGNETITGFLVNSSQSITPVTLTNLNNVPFNVPMGKTLYILSYYSAESNAQLIIHNKIIYQGYASFTLTSTTASWGNIKKFIPVNQGQAVSSNSNSTTINGYYK